MFHISTGTGPARLAGTPDDCARIGIASSEIMRWEDGRATRARPAHTSGGTSTRIWTMAPSSSWSSSTREFSDLNQSLNPGLEGGT
jgi:hypothetical protein